jgi:hypothetical protein
MGGTSGNIGAILITKRAQLFAAPALIEAKNMPRTHGIGEGSSLWGFLLSHLFT